MSDVGPGVHPHTAPGDDGARTGAWDMGPEPLAPGGVAERGAGTILALGLGLLLVAACGAVGLLSQALGASSRAASAADLAALAAADVERGLRPGDSCAEASKVAGLNDASVVSCEIEVPGSTVRVVVEVEGGPLWGPVPGRARAGPPP